MWWAAERARHGRRDVYLDSTQAWTMVWGEEGAVLSREASLQDALSRSGPSLSWSTLRAGVQVWLSGSLAAPFLVGPVSGLKRWPEAMELASAMARDATGMEDCLIALDDWPSRRPAVATAVDAAAFERLRTAAREAQVRIASVRPWWARMAHVVRRLNLSNARALAVDDSESLTLLHWDTSRFAGVTSHTPRPTDDEMQAVLARYLVATGLSRTALLHSAWHDNRLACLPTCLADPL